MTRIRFSENNVNLVGNIGNVESKTLENGNTVYNISLATSKSVPDGENNYKTITQWHKVTVWNLNEKYASKLSKGNRIKVSGELQYDKYTDSNNVNRNVANIVANEIMFYETRNEATNESIDDQSDDLPF